MAEFIKNVLTDEQKFAKEIIDKIFEELEDKRIRSGDLDRYDLEEVMKKINREYKLIPQYDTLKEYLGEHANGAYHKFIFYIDSIKMSCINIEDFRRYYNFTLLDRYVVVEDKQKDNGGNCENYECVHNLTLKRNEELE